ncbi:MAG: pyridoxal phosphate-dependent aminotransferase [Candidatus Methanospirareceae archaeon]
MITPRAAVKGLRAREHGGEPLSGGAKRVCDFSVNLNPYGPPDFVLKTIRDATEEIDRYPDTGCAVLRALLADKYGCAANEILMVAGVSELIQLVALSFVKDRVLMPEHTYGEYEPAARILGAQIVRVAMPGLRIVPDLIIEALQPDDVVFLCNPNNPTGQYLDEEAVNVLVEAAEQVNALVVLDEAYVDFVRDAFPAQRLATQNLIIMRSLTKSFAIPGIRIGYAIATNELITALERVKTPWSVSVIAQKVGAAVLGAEGDAFLAKSRARIERSKKRIEAVLEVHSDANYYLLDVANAANAKNRLLEDGLLVRDCTSFGLPRHIRFSVKKDRENGRLLHAVKAMLVAHE